MKTVTVKIKCGLCDFKATREVKTNEFGYFEIPDAFCPNDFSILNQIVDGMKDKHE